MKKLKSKKIIISAVVVLILTFFIFGPKKEQADNSFIVKSAEFVKTVSINGKVISSDNVDLAFESSGTVRGVSKKVGDKVSRGETIAFLDASDLVADKQSAEADLLAEVAELSKMKDSGNGSDEVTKKTEAINAIEEAYAKSDDAIRNKVDQFFDDPTTGANIKYQFEDDSFEKKVKLNEGRDAVEKILIEWKKMTDSLGVTNYSNQKMQSSIEYVNKIKSFLNELSFAVNSFEESTELPNSKLSSIKSDFALARTNVSTTLSNLTTTKDELRGSTLDIPVQEAKVKSAEAKVSKYNAEIAKTIIRSPISGVISLNDAKIGESISASTKLITVISDDVEVEAFIPEVNIPGISLQNKAVITLDAYPDITFDALLKHIDPGETEKDGVSNYKIELDFIKTDPKIKSGMTADVSIETERRPDVLLIPLRFVFEEDSLSKVFVEKNKKEIETRTITLGSKDEKGNVEITSGLSAQEKILIKAN